MYLLQLTNGKIVIVFCVREHEFNAGSDLDLRNGFSCLLKFLATEKSRSKLELVAEIITSFFVK